MENMWKFNSPETSSRAPKEILKEQAELLPSLTGDMVYASIADERDIMNTSPDMVTDDFIFSFVLQSKFLQNYRFRVLTLSHSIPIYPVKVRLDGGIQKELKLTDDHYSLVKDEDQFVKLLKQVLSSQRIGTVIRSIIQLSK